ncbi:hypothetical protein [Nostoc sp.]|uniref:hypothetical protein n=1 Tax=Nostoc sp. TaxID=1180 RepID=UPI002FFBFACA
MQRGDVIGSRGIRPKLIIRAYNNQGGQDTSLQHRERGNFSGIKPVTTRAIHSWLKLSQSWKINRLLWEIFLGIRLIATFASSFPWRSLFGQEQMGDGLLYWLLIALFTLSNNLLLRLHPELACSQLIGLVIGGIILTLS